MEWSFVFFLNSVLLGVGLAMDAFSRPEDDEKRHGEDRGHLRPFSGGNADDRLGVRAYHRGAVRVL